MATISPPVQALKESDLSPQTSKMPLKEVTATTPHPTPRKTIIAAAKSATASPKRSSETIYDNGPPQKKRNLLHEYLGDAPDLDKEMQAAMKAIGEVGESIEKSPVISKATLDQLVVLINTRWKERLKLVRLLRSSYTAETCSMRVLLEQQTKTIESLLKLHKWLLVGIQGFASIRPGTGRFVTLTADQLDVLKFPVTKAFEVLDQSSAVDKDVSQPVKNQGLLKQQLEPQNKAARDEIDLIMDGYDALPRLKSVIFSTSFSPIPIQAHDFAMNDLECFEMKVYEQGTGKLQDDGQPGEEDLKAKILLATEGYVPDDVIAKARIAELNAWKMKLEEQLAAEKLRTKEELDRSNRIQKDAAEARLQQRIKQAKAHDDQILKSQQLRKDLELGAQQQQAKLVTNHAVEIDRLTSSLTATEQKLEQALKDNQRNSKGIRQGPSAQTQRRAKEIRFCQYVMTEMQNKNTPEICWGLGFLKQHGHDIKGDGLDLRRVRRQLDDGIWKTGPAFRKEMVHLFEACGRLNEGPRKSYGIRLSTKFDDLWKEKDEWIAAN